MKTTSRVCMVCSLPRSALVSLNGIENMVQSIQIFKSYVVAASVGPDMPKRRNLSCVPFACNFK